jgi:hypothetical protein
MTIIGIIASSRIKKPTSINCLVVAGGGGGAGANSSASNEGGGGGAGGYRNFTSESIGASFTVTVGAGGAGGIFSASTGSVGVASTIATRTSSGGGFGANGTTTAGAGGSGGGGGTVMGSTGSGGAGNAGAYSPVEGYAGSAGSFPGPNPGAGGGSSAAAVTTTPGAGTSNSITGSAVTYAAGGLGDQVTPVAGAANTGNGGQGKNSATGSGSAGGSGICVISYPSTFADFASVGGGLTFTKTTSGGNTIYTFTAGTGTAHYAEIRGQVCKRTSYNSNIRGTYAGIGFSYNVEEDIFVIPQPFPSWTRNGSFWEAPIPYPNNNKIYVWNESNINWEEIIPPIE